jgi:hypothetical protein
MPPGAVVFLQLTKYTGGELLSLEKVADGQEMEFKRAKRATFSRNTIGVLKTLAWKVRCFLAVTNTKPYFFFSLSHPYPFSHAEGCARKYFAYQQDV